ncbi:MAG: ATP-binding protein [Leptolyngbyaceae bacterium]|nr:ATP-binding protein [Leptolyngbyaceae bacterium]
MALRTSLRERDLFSSYIPIRLNGSEGDVVGVFELYTDVTPLLQQIRESWRNIVVANLLILTTLYVILFLFVRWAENLIKYQYQQLRDSEERYRHQASELECTLAELQKTQSQMLQSAKMSSLGQLVAGVAHEINNPVTFIHGNLSHVQTYAQDLMKLVNLYQHHYPEPNREIQSAIEHIDLTFIQNDLPKTLASMEIGSDRIREIVLALRIFSRLNEAAIKAVDIHEGLDSTLMILQHRLKPCSTRPEIQVLKNYDALPEVECYPGLLNQVFMNILANAIDTLDDIAATKTYQECLDHPGQIRLQTSLVNDQWVEIAIADNGAGIRLDVQRRIFDPFFTTKPVGKGTGMGLSISYQIVAERHRGTLECFSILGQGTEFRIQIPLKQLTRDSVA